MDNLNPAQADAVTHGGGPLMIVAGAGTGKTTVITRRIAWLIQNGFAKSGEILALTFTEKAASEMEERVDLLLPMGYLDLSIHTFHSFCEKLLREFGTEIGLSRNFNVVDEINVWLLMCQHLDRFKFDYYGSLGNQRRLLKDILKYFTALKEQQITCDDHKKFSDSDACDETECLRLKELTEAYKTYEKILHENNVLDFGGLILLSLKLLRERPFVLARLREKYKYILVDEFQDTNQAQYDLIKLISAPANNLTVVGDDDQSIYKFRGASLSNILKFDEDFPDTKHVVLNVNYRSAQNILDKAYEFIQKNNPARLEIRTGLSKKMSAGKNCDGSIKHVHESSLEKEAERVSELILKIHEDDTTVMWKDICVLVRANDHAEPFVNAFERAGIPYQFMAMRGLYNQPAVLDVLAWLRVIDNPFDDVSAYRVFNHPMLKVSTIDLQKLSFAAQKHGKPMLMLNTTLAEDGVSEDAKEIYSRVLRIRGELIDLARRKRATEMLVFAAENSGLVAHINSMSPIQTRDQFKALQQFYERVKQFETRSQDKLLHNFLKEFDEEQKAGETGSIDFDVESGHDTVRVMTIHSAKGLEFKHVFIVNLVDRRFPSQNRRDAIEIPEGLVQTDEAGSHLEEERRLLYVAMTRAKEKIYLTSARDYGGKKEKKLSQFLYELGFSDNTINSLPKSVETECNFLKIDAPSLAALTDECDIEVPKCFSFTQFEAYRRCPLQYKLAHIFRVPRIGNFQTSFGKSMHNALKLFFEDWIKAGKMPAENLLLKYYDEAWIDDWYPDDGKREECRLSGAESLKKMYAEIVSKPPRPLAVEQAFNIKIGGVIIKGQIDRIDELDGGLHIIDYKTGSAKNEEGLKSEKKEQLFLYQMAVEEIFKKPVKKLSYYYLNGNSSVDFIGSEKDLEKTKLKISEVINGILKRDFGPNPGENCKHCDFAKICEFKKC
jgi:DNA helicase-2/ATP-dependent DNA helicase PcrA